MKFLDHGVMAATFVHLETGKSVRITALEEAREHASKYCGGIENKYARQLEAYKVMAEDELFRVEHVHVEIPQQDLPGRPMRRVKCDKCSEWVQDSRDIQDRGQTLCHGCAMGRYYTVING